MKKLVLTLAVFALMAVLVFTAGTAVSPEDAALPERITAETACPVAGCAQPDGSCHAAAPAPEPDGSFEMRCPVRTGCADVSCHAWDRIGATRSKPVDAAMNLWILAPVVLTVLLVMLVRRSS
jgi:hypothetical protein